jgi:hypothetical protein
MSPHMIRPGVHHGIDIGIHGLLALLAGGRYSAEFFCGFRISVSVRW